MQFPTFDLSNFQASQGVNRQALSNRLDQICKETGFLLLSGHGVPREIITAQWDVIDTFFSLPMEKKREVAVPYTGYPYGWIAPNQEALAASKGNLTPPDLKESFNGGPLSIPEDISNQRAYHFCYQPTLWPDIVGFKSA